jgi:hypothetical protein
VHVASFSLLESIAFYRAVRDIREHSKIGFASSFRATTEYIIPLIIGQTNKGFKLYTYTMTGIIL